MEHGDRKRFAAALLAVSEIYGKPFGDAVSRIWWDALQRFDIDAVEAAFKRHIASPDTGQFQPKPADVIRMLEGTSIDVAQVAWAKVDKAVRSVGPYASVTFDDPIIQRVLSDMGGWILLCGKRDDEWPFIANEFRTRYHGYRSKGGALEEFPRVLIGLVESENAQLGYAAREHVLIGDEKKAQLVFAKGGEQAAIGFQRVDELVKLPAPRETVT